MRHFSSGHLVVALLLTACVPDGCKPDRPGLGDTCVFQFDGAAEFAVRCADDLVCDALVTRTCVEPGAESIACFGGANGYCNGGLACHNGLCEPPIPEGEPCTASTNCPEGTVCNGAAVPGDALAGRCLPVQEEGGACTWRSRRQQCAQGLSCQPLARIDPREAMRDEGFVAWRDQESGESLGIPGACAPVGAPAGAPCEGDSGCASDRCEPLPPPLGLAGEPGFSCDLADECAEFPWPGVCYELGEQILRAPCSRSSDCVPFAYCDASGDCAAWHRGTEGTSCDLSMNGPDEPEDRVCAIGLVCDEESRTCVRSD